jgi:hypothetical protein
MVELSLAQLPLQRSSACEEGLPVVVRLSHVVFIENSPPAALGPRLLLLPRLSWVPSHTMMLLLLLLQMAAVVVRAAAHMPPISMESRLLAEPKARPLNAWTAKCYNNSLWNGLRSAAIATHIRISMHCSTLNMIAAASSHTFHSCIHIHRKSQVAAVASASQHAHAHAHAHALPTCLCWGGHQTEGKTVALSASPSPATGPRVRRGGGGG